VVLGRYQCCLSYEKELLIVFVVVQLKLIVLIMSCSILKREGTYIQTKYIQNLDRQSHSI